MVVAGAESKEGIRAGIAGEIEGTVRTDGDPDRACPAAPILALKAGHQVVDGARLTVLEANAEAHLDLAIRSDPHRAAAMSSPASGQRREEALLAAPKWPSPWLVRGGIQTLGVGDQQLTGAERHAVRIVSRVGEHLGLAIRRA